ncbi:hypothetical protein HYDPIDRAFT_98309 [Hydnomerulius pinastri MD-312]|uniref:Nucleolar protein 16 n=1 Tax=Hydnomerulius pinastri MD-312 TaxID=994086 RepID=A0A0C9WAT9_9AGAM|nr:hypothetical protein HYDPIDRAFT_98309 [Hydnomerulius pinastri MD-312]
MANPRQRRKAKSSTHKAISHSKRAKKLLKKMPAIRGPKALQDAWDPSKTVRQNYLALGLQHNLNPISSGGSELNPNNTASASRTPYDDGTSGTSQPRTVASELPKGFGRIVRDSTGAVIRVELPRDEEDERPPQQDMDIGGIMTADERRVWVQASSEHSASRVNSGDGDNIVVKNLHNLAASAHAKQRHTSSGEKMYLARLVKKYDDDFEGMAHDRQLNPEQKTAGELKRAMTKAGGLEMLRGVTL